MRYRWFKAEFKGDGFEMLKRSCQEYSYNEISGQGFRLEIARDKFIKGKYIVRKEIEDNTIDPFGNETKYKRIIFETFKFKLSRDFPEITIIDSPRSIHPFLTKLSLLSDFSFFVSQLTLNINSWLNRLETTEGLDCIVKQISCSGISLSPSVAGKLSIAGSEDVRKYLLEMTGSKNFVIDKARLIIQYLNEKHECQISRHGNINILSGNDNNVLDVLSNSLSYQI